MKRPGCIARKTRLRDTPIRPSAKSLERKVRLRAPGTPARTDRGWNSSLKPGKPLKAKGGSRFPKRRAPLYMAWVRTLPCVVLDRGECWGWTEAAHVVRTRGAGAYDVGEVVPLCHKHHSEQEGRTARFNTRYGLNLAAIAAALPTRYESEAA